MGPLESVIIAVCVLLCLAFVIRVVIEIWSIIYAMAPYIVGVVVIVFLLLSVGYTGSEQETEVKDANHIESIEDTSGRGEH